MTNASSCIKVINGMPRLQIIAHNIRSRENVGSLFRTCDSLGVERLWLTGYTPAPPDHRIHKVALGAEAMVPFSTSVDLAAVFRLLRADGFFIFALELAPTALNLAETRFPDRVGLVLGSEVEGVVPFILEQCDGIVEIKQRGLKESLNVSVAAGIAAWAILR